VVRFESIDKYVSVFFTGGVLTEFVRTLAPTFPIKTDNNVHTECLRGLITDVWRHFHGHVMLSRDLSLISHIRVDMVHK